MREGRRLETLIDDLAWLARHDEHVPKSIVSTSTSRLATRGGSCVRLLSELSVTRRWCVRRASRRPGDAETNDRNVVDNDALRTKSCDSIRTTR